MFIPEHPKNAVGDHYVGGTYAGIAHNIPGVEEYTARGVVMHLNGATTQSLRLQTSLKDPYDAWAEYATSDLNLQLPFVQFDDRPGQYLNGPNRERPAIVFKFMDWVIAQRPELAAGKILADQLDHKGRFVRLAQHHDVPTPLTTFVDGLDGSVVHPEWPGYPCWIKDSVGASGLSMVLCVNEAEFGIATRRSGDYQVQAHIDGAICSAQLWIDDHQSVVLMTTDQIMTGRYRNIHSGNIFPSLYDVALRPVAQRLGDTVRALGFRGYCGFDFMVAGQQVYVLEMNPRLTGAHYPGALAGQLEVSSWMNVSIEHVRNDLRDVTTFIAHLRSVGLLWTRKNTAGTVPWFLAALHAGKAMLLIPGSRAEQQRLLRAAQEACC